MDELIEKANNAMDHGDYSAAREFLNIADSEATGDTPVELARAWDRWENERPFSWIR